MQKNTDTSMPLLSFNDIDDIEAIIIATMVRTFNVVKQLGDQLFENPKFFYYIESRPDGKTKMTVIPKSKVVFVTAVYKSRQNNT